MLEVCYNDIARGGVDLHNIHVTRKGEVIDLLALNDDEFAFYNECLQAYRENLDTAYYLRLIQAPNNPLMKGSRMVTKEIAYSPLGRAVWDLYYRLAIRKGEMAAGQTSTHINEEPAQEDDFVTTQEAADRAGVTVQAIHEAIKRGDLAAHQEENGRWKVSVRSLDQYTPDPVRQAAAKKGD